MELSAYSTSDVYDAGACLRMSAPVYTSEPVCARYSMTGPVPMAGAYIFLNMSSALVRRSCSSMLVISPTLSRSPTEVTGTPGATSARGRPLPMLTAVSTFSLSGSISLIVRPSHPSVPTLTGSQVCHMSMALKWDLLEFS